MALLINQAWRLQQSPTTLSARVLKSKYLPRTSIFESRVNLRASHIWKSIYIGLQELRKGVKWVIGDGNSVRVWEDNWLLGGSLRNHIVGPMLPNEELRLFRSLRVNHMWTFEDLPFPIPLQLKNTILGIPVAHPSQVSDTFVCPQIKASAPSGRPQNFFINRWISLQIPPCGVGYGSFRAQRKYMYSFGSLCAICYLLDNICLSLVLRLTALGVII